MKDPQRGHIIIIHIKINAINISYEAKSDLTTHNTKIHAQHECKV